MQNTRQLRPVQSSRPVRRVSFEALDVAGAAQHCSIMQDAALVLFKGFGSDQALLTHVDLAQPAGDTAPAQPSAGLLKQAACCHLLPRDQLRGASIVALKPRTMVGCAGMAVAPGEGATET